ncbi:MAG: Fis family transcriptional regulator, partial [Gammaproteobacteria bacterium]|nr:Fis family transcriptional regulator [Gammaproteobacteria bacterium]
MTNQHIGSPLGDFLSEQGMLAECQAGAIKRVISWQLEKYLVDTGTTKVDLAKQLDTSRASLDRLLDE